MTKKLYLENTYQFYSEGVILESGKDEKGLFVILDQTVFYPQGGGQPSDQGGIKTDQFETKVTHVAQVNKQIRHYITPIAHDNLVKLKAQCFVNPEIRILNARYHTAAHLLGNVVENLNPRIKAFKGHSFPREAYVEFEGDEAVDLTDIQNAVNTALDKNFRIKIFEIDGLSFEQKFYKLPYKIPENNNFRAMQIGDMLPVPCGGTHLSSTADIGNITISKIKSKNNILRISYEVT
ncbi:MAG: putative metal-dependent hydrolase [Rickettsiaceae bacterium]|jgi:alanyl-tRNA synthetase|nr:putative metal-dependent hydrolase [Rickettsiaceae bacterium]